MKINIIPLPINAPETTCGAQWILGSEVQANQNNPDNLLSQKSLVYCRHLPIGSKIDPTIIGGSRSSGLSLCVAFQRFAYHVLLNTPVQIADVDIPTNMLRKGREAMSGLQPRRC
jgi:hypothetical protein